MTIWLKVQDTSFPLHAMRFLIPRKFLVEHGFNQLLDSENPDTLYSELKILLHEFRPELDDGNIEYFGFDPNCWAFFVTVSHASLPKVEFGAEFQKQLLERNPP
jgi:hypothetical protein